MPTSPYTLGTPSTDPGDTSNVISGVYAPKSKSFFLARMIATLRSSGLKLYQFGAGSLPHRFMDAIALELANLDRQWANSIARAIREAGYAAVGITRLPATFATGAGGRFVRNSPATSTETIPAGTVVSTTDGRTAVTLADLVFAPGQRIGTVSIRSEIVGVGGNYAVGELTNILASIPYTFSNYTVVDGGQEEETDDALQARAQDVYQGLTSSKASALVTAALGVTIAGPVGVRDACVINPFLIADLNIPPGVFYMVVESGGGTAPLALVNAVDAVMVTKRAAGVSSVTISASAYVASVAISYSYPSSLSTAAINTQISALWADQFYNSKIEDGTGRGEVDTSLLAGNIADQIPEISNVVITVSGGSTVKPPLTYRALGGIPTYTATGY